MDRSSKVVLRTRELLRHLREEPGDCGDVDGVVSSALLSPEVVKALTSHRDATRTKSSGNQVAKDIHRRRASAASKD